MVTPAVMFLWLAAATGLATPAEVGVLLDQIGDGDLALMYDPQSARPVRVLLATRVAVPPDKLRARLSTPAVYKQAMPAFRRIDVIGQRERDGGTDVHVAWELDVPLWNLAGKLWLAPQPDGADLVLEEGGFSPGLFHLRAYPTGTKSDGAILTIEGFANVGEANVAARQLAKRSPLVEPAMTVAAGYVVLKSLARLFETGEPGRPTAALVAPSSTDFEGGKTGSAAQAFASSRTLIAVVRSHADGRLSGVEAAVRLSPKAARRAAGGLRPAWAAALPGWQKVGVVTNPDTCQDPSATCWAVDTNLPLFSLDGTWKIRTRPWRARMVAGDREGALLALDLPPAKAGQSPVVVWSEHPRLDRGGLIARKLIAAEPFLEHGLALALTLVDAASLAPALERN